MSELQDARDELLAAKESGDKEAQELAAEKVVALRQAQREGSREIIGGDAVKEDS